MLFLTTLLLLTSAAIAVPLPNQAEQEAEQLYWRGYNRPTRSVSKLSSGFTDSALVTDTLPISPSERSSAIELSKPPARLLGLPSLPWIRHESSVPWPRVVTREAKHTPHHKGWKRDTIDSDSSNLSAAKEQLYWRSGYNRLSRRSEQSEGAVEGAKTTPSSSSIQQLQSLERRETITHTSNDHLPLPFPFHPRTFIKLPKLPKLPAIPKPPKPRLPFLRIPTPPIAPKPFTRPDQPAPFGGKV